MIGLVCPSIIKETTCSYNIISFHYANYFIFKKYSFSLIFLFLTLLNDFLFKVCTSIIFLHQIVGQDFGFDRLIKRYVTQTQLPRKFPTITLSCLIGNVVCT